MFKNQFKLKTLWNKTKIFQISMYLISRYVKYVPSTLKRTIHFLNIWACSICIIFSFFCLFFSYLFIFFNWYFFFHLHVLHILHVFYFNHAYFLSHLNNNIKFSQAILFVHYFQWDQLSKAFVGLSCGKIHSWIKE